MSDDLKRETSVTFVIQRRTKAGKWLDWSAVYHDVDSIPAMETELARLRRTEPENTWRPLRRETSIWESLVE